MSDSFELLSRHELSRRREELLSRIRRRYDIVEEPLLIGPLRITFTRVKDPNRVLDEVCAEEDSREKQSGERHEGDDLHLPYWAELWDSAIGVGYFLVESYTNFLAGPLAGRVHLRSKQPGPQAGRLKVLDLGCGMGLAGTIAAAMGHQVLLADIETPALLFAKLNTLAYARRVRICKLNWQRDHLGEQFDLVLGADVLYERAQ